ncbi:MAG: hypothetical protein J6S21_02445 [Victivallales bacterium]|nr:hypothetical protein [Victivallales bacterium]
MKKAKSPAALLAKLKQPVNRNAVIFAVVLIVILACWLGYRREAAAMQRQAQQPATPVQSVQAPAAAQAPAAPAPGDCPEAGK